MDNDTLIKYYKDMLLIRRFEEKAAEMYTLGKIGGFCHLYIGQEAVAVGGIAAIKKDDYVITAYRDHGHALAIGTDPKLVMAELFGKATGICKGKGGSMHLFDKEKNLLGGFAIVGGHIPLATGVGFAIKYRKEDKVCLCFFGEGAVNSGAFHESLNMAALWKLPVIFICENNRYGMGTPVERASAIYDIARRGSSYDMEYEHLDGVDVTEVTDHIKMAVDRAREESLPKFIEIRTYRFMGHSMADPAHGHYRTREELTEQKRSDPINFLQERLTSEGLLDDNMVKGIGIEIEKIVTDAVAFADSSPYPPVESVHDDLYV
ncbi:MAG: pyruvate dehydrogenase (acetyl-transferring) E1 component subunit alpha [Nitrospirota bacterium]